MTGITVAPATPDRFEDIRAVLDGSGEVGCWCQAWRGTDADRLELDLDLDLDR